MLQAAYTVAVSRNSADFAGNLLRIFLPSGQNPGRLIRGQAKGQQATVEVFYPGINQQGLFTDKKTTAGDRKQTGANAQPPARLSSIYIPEQDFLAGAPGFTALHTSRETRFPETYADLLYRAYRPPLRAAPDPSRQALPGALETPAAAGQ